MDVLHTFRVNKSPWPLRPGASLSIHHPLSTKPDGESLPITDPIPSLRCSCPQVPIGNSPPLQLHNRSHGAKVGADDSRDRLGGASALVKSVVNFLASECHGEYKRLRVKESDPVNVMNWIQIT